MALGPGLDVEWDSGSPIDRDRPLKPQAQERYRQTVDRATVLRSALADPEGSAVVSLVTDRLADRIEQLVRNDPEASAYVKILSEVNHELALGRRAAEALMGLQLREAHSARRP